MSSPPPDDFPQLEESGHERTPEEIARAEEVAGAIRGEGGYMPPSMPAEQWEARVDVILPSGERQEQYIRVPREPGDTAQDVRDKLLLAQIEIETIIAERGGEYEVSAVVGEFWEI